MPWQLELFETCASYAAEQSAIAELWLLGSAQHPESLDQWSDLDLGLVPAAEVDLDALLGEIGSVWAVDQQTADRRSTCRVVFSDGRRLDLVVAESAEFARSDARLEFAAEGRTASADIKLVRSAPTVHPAVNEARFISAQALIKFGREDRLIGTHLLLELVRICLVQAMLLRDRDESQSSHRFGTTRDDLAADIISSLYRQDGPIGVDTITQSCAIFDQLRRELDPTYLPDWSGLTALRELVQVRPE